MHSLYFPFSWKEAVVNPINLMMISGQITRNMTEADHFNRVLFGEKEGEPGEQIKYQKLLMTQSVETLFTK
jgi:hypothetical protein